MALWRERDELAPYVIQELELLQQGQEQGAGSYGAVYRVKVRGFPCIAKRLHAILLGRVREVDVSDRERAAILQRFREECVLLGKLRHPNIVQFIGVHYGQTPEDLTLVMECLYTDLDKCLQRCVRDRENRTMPLPIQLTILLDVSYGLLYLHSQNPPIVHRDLTASNVLLTEDMRAKLADLGVSRLLDLHPMSATAQTVCPGTLGVMPPEALVENPQYDVKLDDFSYGTLALHTVNHEFAMPFEVPHATIGVVQIARRRSAIEKMGADHCLYDLVIQCLQDDPRRRPTTAEICATLEQLSRQYPKQFKDILELYVWLDQLHQANDQQLRELQTQLHQKEVECRELLQQHETATAHDDPDSSIPQLMQEDEDHAFADGNVNTPTSSPCGIAGNLMQVEGKQQTQENQPLLSVCSIELEFDFCGDTPATMLRGAATVHNNTAYFSSYDSNTIHSYSTEGKVWDKLPDCPVKNFGLAVIHGAVTTVGGNSWGIPRRTLYSLKEEWKEELPPMPSRIINPAIAQSGEFLIVAGGRAITAISADIQVLNTETQQWSLACPLPEPLASMSAAICGDRLYLLGGENSLDVGGVTCSSFRCTLSSLLNSCQLPDQAASATSLDLRLWERVADVPWYLCTCAAVGGEVLAIGGRAGWGWNSKSDVYCYNPDSNSWELIGHLQTPRFWNIVVVLPGEKLMVVGGKSGPFALACDAVEIWKAAWMLYSKTKL